MPVTPVVNGSPVAFVSVAEVGVPKIGVTSVGLVDSTFAPEPVLLVTPVPPLATGSVPVTFVVRFAKVVDVVPVPPLATGSVPVTCVVRLTPDSAPPRVRLPVLVTVPESVMPLTVPVPPTEETDPPPVPAPMAARKDAASREETVLSALKRGNVTALGLVIVKRLPPNVVAPKLVRAVAAVDAAEPPLAIGRMPVTPVVSGKPVAFVRVPDVGVPKIGVTSVGLVDKTVLPVPVEVVTPVPPLATGSVPVTLVAKFTKVVDVEPVPPLAMGSVPVTLVARLTKVVELEPVPPEVTGSAVPKAKEPSQLT